VGQIGWHGPFSPIGKSKPILETGGSSPPSAFGTPAAYRRNVLHCVRVFAIKPASSKDVLAKDALHLTVLPKAPTFPRILGACLAVLAVSGCASLHPSNYRNWEPNQARLPYAEFDGHRVTVRNVRRCGYLSDKEYVVQYVDRTYDLDKLATVDFIVIPFKQWRALAHTMLSFGFDDGQYVVVSVEVRRERGEEYSFLDGVRRKYEIMYVVGDERDLINLRANYRNDEVYLYRTRATREAVRDLFVKVMARVNKLAAEPEFYNTFTNNCTTNIVRHINELAPNRVPYGIHVLLPGLSDRLAYDLGLIDTDLPFEETKRRAKITHLARIYQHAPDFSAKIRR